MFGFADDNKIISGIENTITEKDIKGFQIKIDEQTNSIENHRHSTSEPPFSWLYPLFPQS
jgi:hypothetical protein